MGLSILLVFGNIVFEVLCLIIDSYELYVAGPGEREEGLLNRLLVYPKGVFKVVAKTLE